MEKSTTNLAQFETKSELFHEDLRLQVKRTSHYLPV